MTTTGVILRIIRKIPLLREIAINSLRRRVLDEKRRLRLNKWYYHLDMDSLSVFQNIFCKIFRNNGTTSSEGFWEVKFRSSKILMPLRPEKMWLDWDSAVSILGHDQDVKETYINLLNASLVNVFFDLGANYGTHSLLFLSQGIKTVSFEPNNTLNENFEFLCRLNNFKGRMENVALSNSEGEINLYFPENESWLGTIEAGVASDLNTKHKLSILKVPVTTLDKYVLENDIYPDLLKIDTEGNELNVFKGAQTILDKYRPYIIFESNTPKDREEIWDLLTRHDYLVLGLPFKLGMDKNPYDRATFTSLKQFNYIAVPKEK